jgi:hypothetical protein
VAIHPVLPLPAAVLWTLAFVIVEAVEISIYGPQQLLWFSHLALIGITVTDWTGSRLLASILAVGLLLPELAWIVDVAIALIAGVSPTGATAYLFDPTRSLAARLVSLFHLSLAPMILLLVMRLGYERRAWWVQSVVVVVVFVLSWLQGPQENINGTWGLSGPQQLLSPVIYLMLWMGIYVLAIHLPSHLILRRWLTGSSAAGEDPGAQAHCTAHATQRRRSADVPP